MIDFTIAGWRFQIPKPVSSKAAIRFRHKQPTIGRRGKFLMKALKLHPNSVNDCFPDGPHRPFEKRPPGSVERSARIARHMRLNAETGPTPAP
ncbi:MAG: hypothetical protein WDN50_22845 [Bradyrhizobium sp.]